MDLANQRKPDDRLFVDAAEQVGIHSLLDLLHRHVQKETSLGRSHEHELIFGFEYRHVLYRNYDQLRRAADKNSLQLTVTPDFIKLRLLRLRRSSIETR